jgi:hypothetical protein
MTPPIAIEPTSPMKIFALGAFHQRKPTSAPTNDAAMIVRSIGSRRRSSRQDDGESLRAQRCWNCQNETRL